MEQDASPGRAVGRLLRDQRLAREFSIETVAARLNIRVRYLEAIEQGRFDQLPGAAYIPAFLRAYATHVGLDPDKVLTAYQLSGPVPIARPTVLPADFPLVEKRAPIGLAVLTILILVGAGYAVWQYLPHHQTLVSQKVPPVPDRLLASPAPASPTSVPADQPASPPVQEARVPVAPAPAAPAPVAPTPAEMWTGPSPKPESSPVVASPPPAIVPAPAPVIVSAPPPPPVVMPTPAFGQAQAAQVPVVVPRPAPTPAPQEAAARGSPEPGVPAMTATLPMRSDTQVFVRANSWLELRSPAGDILAQTYVRAGESYTVPAGISYRVIDAR
jgi:cytoskeleton protein RodZ